MTSRRTRPSLRPRRAASRARRLLQDGLRAAGALALVALVVPALAQTAPPPNETPPADKPPKVDLEKLNRPAAPAAPSNLFGSRSWQPKVVPKKVVPPPPPPPQAPPMPFTYVGRWVERGDTLVMLSRGGTNYTVREGEKVDGSYLLEKVDRDRLVLRYVPLDQAQVLPFAGGAPPGAVAQPVPGLQPLPQQQKRGSARDADDEED